jgi:hypothetical protein
MGKTIVAPGNGSLTPVRGTILHAALPPCDILLAKHRRGTWHEGRGSIYPARTLPKCPELVNHYNLTLVRADALKRAAQHDVRHPKLIGL